MVNLICEDNRLEFQGVMGLIKNTIIPSIDIRLEREMLIDSLEKRSDESQSKAFQLPALINDIIQRVMALMFLVATSPLLILVAIWIKLDSSGPVFFRQKRMGLGGKIFRIIKFRTMVFNAEKDTGPVLARIDDERVTRAGRILRHLRIDEIPQMLNVLAGEMALVGPRPERPEIFDAIIVEMPEFFKRLDVKPGITGLAQIRGDYHTEPVNKLRYDLLYIKRRCFTLDMKIIAITAYICLLRKGAC